jgi:glycosyltransferase involved in cell wall biosynthesis
MQFEGKHIVIVGPAHPLRGGLATYNERLARELMQKNQVTLLTFSLQYPNFLFPGQSQFSDDPKPEDLTIDIALNSVNPLNWISVGRKYKKVKPDIIIFRYWMPFFGPCFGTFARIVKSNHHTQVVAITDNIIPHEKRFFDTPFSKYFLPVLDGAVAMSRKVLKDLQDFPLSKPVKKTGYHAHPLYDNFGQAVSKSDACTALGLDANKRHVLFFGFIRNYKGLDLLLEAMALLPESLKDVNLLIAGEYYEDSAPYDKIIAEKQLENRIDLHTKFIPNDDVRLYFSAADIVAQPYRNATQSGVSQIAYHFETPMIITNVGGLSELVPHGEAGWVCEPTSESLAAAVISMYEPGRIEHVRTSLKELKKQFSWPSMVKALEEVTS